MAKLHMHHAWASFFFFFFLEIKLEAKFLHMLALVNFFFCQK
jgi:hypothetical protein